MLTFEQSETRQRGSMSVMDATTHVSAEPPVAHARRHADGSWYVAVTWQNGRREQTGRFKLATEAENYIAEMLQAWHDGHRAFALKRK